MVVSIVVVLQPKYHLNHPDYEDAVPVGGVDFDAESYRRGNLNGQPHRATADIGRDPLVAIDAVKDL